LGVPALDIKVVPADTDRFGEGHTFNASPSPATADAVRKTCAKISEKGQLMAAMALGAAPSNLRWENGAWTNGRGPEAVKTLEDVALYAHGSGDLPPGVDGGLDARTVY
jgi:carbon-monoxide dehydrogenase large subunit